MGQKRCELYGWVDSEFIECADCAFKEACGK